MKKNMKLIIFISLIITIANALVVNKERNRFHHKGRRRPIITATPTTTTPTKTEPTNIKYKRAKTTTYYDKQEYIIFEEGMDAWNEDWEETSWNVPRDINKIVNGIIQVSLVDGSGFALSSKTLDSKYGILSFEYKFSEPNAKLNVLTYNGDDPNAYVGLGSYIYSGDDFDSVEIKVKNKDEFVQSIKRFAFQNYGNDGKELTFYIRKMVYKDIGYTIEKYEESISVIDKNECKLSTRWENISPNTDIISFEEIKNRCVMKLNMKDSDELLLKLKNIKFYGGKFVINIKGKVNSIFAWGAINSEEENTDIFIEKDNYMIETSYKEFVNSDFEDKDYEYDTLKFITLSDEIECYIQDIQFYPIAVNGKIQLYETTQLTEPEVILDENGLYWTSANWGTTQCDFNTINECMECSFEGKVNGWPGFGFTSDKLLDSGTLVVVMKVLIPNKNINIICFDINGKNYDVKTFTATTEYEEYRIPLLHFEDLPTNKYAIQEASQSSNTYYIKNIIYYPDYIDLPEGSAVPTKTKTKTKTQTATVIAPTSVTDIYQQKGYDICSVNTKVSFSDGSNNLGLENNKWCAVLSENIECWSNLQGYKCCSESATIEDNGVWGTEEDGTKCGVNKTDVCWSKELGYECCDKTNTKIILIDEYGIWGATDDDKWCGIINIKE